MCAEEILAQPVMRSATAKVCSTHIKQKPPEKKLLLHKQMQIMQCMHEVPWHEQLRRRLPSAQQQPPGLSLIPE
jgi:hypothetical protein